jgi:uncharacterized protein (TIGR00369 family)
MLTLPRTHSCLVCGRDNAHGLRLRLHVGEDGMIRTHFTPADHHGGFEGILHGGVLATVADEAMAWAAAWAGKRFCVAAELTIRFLSPAKAGVELRVEARVDLARSRLITAGCMIVEAGSGRGIAEAGGKYTPMSADHNARVIATFVDEPDSHTAAAAFRA